MQEGGPKGGNNWKYFRVILVDDSWHLSVRPRCAHRDTPCYGNIPGEALPEYVNKLLQELAVLVVNPTGLQNMTEQWEKEDNFSFF